MHHPYSLDQLADDVLLRNLVALVSRDRTTTAALLAHIAEVDARRLYAAAGYPSMHAYCVEELRLSESAAFKRITAARIARRHPALFGMVADGRLHLTAVRLLTPYLTEENADDLLAAAADLRTPALELLLARRFPPEAGFATSRSFSSLIPIAEPTMPSDVTATNSNPSQLAAGRVEGDATSPDASTDAPECYRLQVTIEKATHDRLRYAQALLGHAVPSGDVAQVIDRALEALILQLEKRKFAATPKPRARSRRPTSPHARLIPADVRRTVWKRDGGRCTFVGAGGHRCGSSRAVEFDHVTPVARGGRSSVENLRLRCRTHNQFEAERAFGAEFMESQRRRARWSRVAAGTQASLEPAGTEAPAAEIMRNVEIALRTLGFRADEARRAARFPEVLHGGSLEECLRAALRRLRPGVGRQRRSPARETAVPPQERGPNYASGSSRRSAARTGLASAPTSASGSATSS